MPTLLRIFESMPARLAACALSLALCAPTIALAKPVLTDHVEAELVAERNAIVPGQPLRAGLRLRMDREWHTYWRNPGDTGLPTTIAWTLPPGFSAGDIEWPAPKRIDIVTFANYGYENEVVLPVTIATPASIAPGMNVPLRAHAEWLVCREQCIPGSADLELGLPVATTSDVDSRWSALFAAAKRDAPRPAGDWHWSGHKGQGGQGDRIDLVWTPAAGAPTPSSIQFFSYAEGVIEPAAKQALYRLPDGRLRLNLQLAKTATTLPASLEGVLTSATGWPAANEGNVHAIEFAARVDAIPLAAAGVPVDTGVAFASGAQSQATTLWFAIALALAGGIVLNLMPCVFPIISLKVLGFAQQAHGRKSVLRAHGLVFAAGVVASFAVLAGIALALRASGAQVGWGFQLQSPVVIA